MSPDACEGSARAIRDPTGRVPTDCRNDHGLEISESFALYVRAFAVAFTFSPIPPLLVADLRKSCVNANSVKSTKTPKISENLREIDLFEQLCFV